MKHTKWAVLVMFVTLSGLAVAQTIGSTRIVTEVPFEFVAANRIVPAGQCVVQAGTMDRKTLMLNNVAAKVGKADASHYALVFNRYGDRYFLTGVKLEGSRISYRLPESKGEAELRAQNVPATEETLLASTK
jgi:hypothetical protein